ncbi:carbohydrate ABC transporter permease [Deinococcus planocerae]|uniref:carbohydrate ABC transporter permease n=1 Tax=Deinococcus planocerae TaxID=1737569 RepID=UPI000C7F4E4B|nr:carbohydrate ABC transporter permease [Deinococcus planocerae]
MIARQNAPVVRATARPRLVAPRALLHLCFIAVLLVWVSPFVWIFLTAFKPSAEVYSQPLALLPSQPTLENFQRAWTNASFSVYFLNTVIVTLSTTLIVLFVTALAGYALGRRAFRGRALIVAILSASIFLPQGYTIIPIYDLINRLGLNNTLTGVILASAGVGFIIYTFMFSAYFAGLPGELEEAARMDGANIFQVFFRVMLPLARPVIASVFILEFLQIWNSFLIPLVLTLSSPEKRVLGVGMYAFSGQSGLDWTGLAAAATISLVPVIAVFLLLQRHFVEGVAGAVKS